MKAITDNITNNEISSKNREGQFSGNSFRIFNVILLIAIVSLSAMLISACAKEPESYPEAESYVASELDALKTSDAGVAVPDAINDAAEQFDSSMLDGYIDKLKDFDYDILGSGKADNGNDKEVAVTVRITTYDFANEYLKAWEQFMTVEDENRWQSQFYSHLLLRLASVTNKDYTSDVQIICTEGDDGKWTSDFKSNEDLMNALSGGMLDEMNKLMTDDVVMDETEVNGN